MSGQKPVAKFKAGQVLAAIGASSIPAKNGRTPFLEKYCAKIRFNVCFQALAAACPLRAFFLADFSCRF